MFFSAQAVLSHASKVKTSASGSIEGSGRPLLRRQDATVELLSAEVARPNDRVALARHFFEALNIEDADVPPVMGDKCLLLAGRGSQVTWGGKTRPSPAWQGRTD